VPAWSRRRALGAGAAGVLAAAWPARRSSASAPDAPLARWIRHPLLARSLYRHAVSKDYDDVGAAGVNVQGYQWIEEQRQGAEWIVRGTVQRRADWMALGWRELDWGVAQQQRDGGFASKDAFHSTSFFIEALARSCLLDPEGAIAVRVSCLRRAADWLTAARIETAGADGNRPYTHRRYIVAAALGQAAQVTREARFAEHAIAWADQGLDLQAEDGTNPEKGGFDAGYQMVGVLFALRYLAVCPDTAQGARLRDMIRRAIVPELARQREDGSIDAGGSTRIELEHARSGKTKEVPYGEIVQALVFASQAVPEPAWIDPAQRIVRLRGW
jgi:hypothetical protein